MIVIVTRYFGGTKLGTGGLRRAFFEAADSCLSSSKIIEKLIKERLEIIFDYKFMDPVMRLLNENKIDLIKNESDENCRLIIEVRLSKLSQLKEELKNITKGSVMIG